MKLLKLLPVFVLLVLSVTTVIATHVPQVSLQSTDWSANTETDVSFNVANSGDPIVKVELSVPEANLVPLYKVLEVSTPEGWTYDTTSRVGQTPYKVTWYTDGVGITTGNELTFGIRVLTPSQASEQLWAWKTTDANGASQSGDIKTETVTAPVAKLRISTPSKVKAGSAFVASVTVYDSMNRVKTDYTGTILLASSDSLAIMPEKYTFTASDNGYKSFTIRMKTAGMQTVSVNDANNKISAVSAPIDVEAGTLVSLAVIADKASVNVGETVVFNAVASDLYGNKVDVTSNTIWDIDNEAKGSWSKNVYKAGAAGLWTVTARYLTLEGGVSLNVGGQAVEPVQVEVPQEIPIEAEITPNETEPEVPETQTAELSIAGEDTVVIPAASNDTMILTVSNNGNVNLTGVEIGFEGIPSDWVLTFPLSSNIDAGESKDFLVILYVPENETGTKDITFTATSDQGANAEKDVTLKLEAPPTGLFEAIPSNILQLGVVIIAVAAVIIIGYELWFKK